MTETVFNYTRRGLFEKDKLTIAAMLCLSILKRRGTLSSAELECLIVSKSHAEPGGMGRLSEWMTEVMWAKVRALEIIPEFEKLGDDMQQDVDEWHSWFNLEKPDQAPLPGEYNTMQVRVNLYY